ncbi:hypothetical protein ES705_17160 [subsurface metagenome]
MAEEQKKPLIKNQPGKTIIDMERITDNLYPDGSHINIGRVLSWIK